MNAITDHELAGAAYAVVADVIHGHPAAPVLGEGQFCSIECAGVGVYQLTRSLSASEQGAAVILRRHNRPVGYVVTRDGRMWRVEALPIL
ncbi:hypothetical protein ACIQVL_04955 [Streptomyces sp. NPDC090499]|uniref:hypothetical protein n=1 Tax=Streptomyces sp. NPDC090499 TaxID=3365965 RepID=UPI0038212958